MKYLRLTGPAQSSQPMICLTITQNNVQRGMQIAAPTQLAGYTELAAHLEEEEAARAFAAALANTAGPDEYDGLGYAIASQEVLARDWLTPEDAVDWSTWFIPGEE